MNKIKKSVLSLFLILGFFFSSHIIITPGLQNIGTLVNQNQNFNSNIKISQGNNYSLEFDGNDYIVIKNHESLNPTTQITIMAWICSESWDGNGRIIQKGDSDNQYILCVFQSNKILFQITGLSTNYITVPTPSSGVWHHVTGTYDGFEMKIYIDGVLNNSIINSGNIPTSNSDFHIGTKRVGSYPEDFFHGKIDEIRLYNRALNNSEIETIFNMNNSNTNGLVLYHNFEQISDNTCYDQSGNNNHGTIYGATQSTDTPPLNNGISDSDNDGLSDYNEINIHLTNPHNNDTDNDLLSDYEEIFTYSTDPLDPDSDDDGLNDGSELNTYGTDPLDSDTDGDGVDDGIEVNTYGIDPLDSDTDGDGVDDGEEIANGTDPNSPPSSVEFSIEDIIIPIIVIVVIILGVCSIFLYLHLTKDKRERAKQEKMERKEREMRERDVFTKKQQELRERRAREEKERMEKERLERERINREYLEKEKRDRERLEMKRQKRLINEKEILEKIRKMMNVSTKINLEMMRKALKLDENTFSEKIFEWASEFEFTIDNDVLIIKQETISDFIDELDKQFDTWRKEEEERTSKP